MVNEPRVNYIGLLSVAGKIVLYVNDESTDGSFHTF